MKDTETKKYSRKIIVLCMIMLIVTVIMGTRMAYLQLVRGPEIANSVKNISTRTYAEVASRGEIKDRNGNVLVADVACFDLIFDYYEWEKAKQNQVILQLCTILEQAQKQWSDELPITEEAPYTYTYASRDSGSGKKLMKFISQREWDQNITATRLFTLLCERYGVDEGLTSRQKRMIIGVRYYLELCQFSAYNSPITIATDVDIDTVVEVSALSQQLPGVTVEVGARREYFTSAAAHILGRVAAISTSEYDELKSSGYRLTDSIGKMGVEKAFESYLRGIDGKKAVDVDRLSGDILNEYSLLEPEPGDNVILTVELKLQEVAEKALADTLEEIKADGNGDVEGGAVVVLDAKSGEILAMGSYPTYNLATYGADYNQNSNDPLKPFFNRSLAGEYPPGSTFKMVTALAALEEGIVTALEKMQTKGVYTYYAPTYTPACWYYNEYGKSHGSINVSEALKYSCNYFFYEVGRIMGIETLNKYASMLGLGQKTGIEIGGEKEGNLAGPENRLENGGGKWYESETIQAAIGQTEQQFTPLQVASYVATIVNGGKKYQPHIIKQINNYTDTEVVMTTEISYTQLDISSSTIRAIKEGMRGVVTEDGTASAVFKDFPIEVGGKTGSAQTQKGKKAHGVFVSFAPYDDPEIVVCVTGDYAGSGGSVAPVCIEIYKEYFGLNAQEPSNPSEPQE